MNAAESNARAFKAMRMADALGSLTGAIWLATGDGTDPPTHADVLAVAEDFDAKRGAWGWAHLAATIGVRAPSQATVDLTLRFLRDRAEHSDPFDRLPS